MKEINELNNLLSKYIDQGFFPGVQWQINIDGIVYTGKYGLNNIDTKYFSLNGTNHYRCYLRIDSW